jgi:hypothetical protein
MLRGRCSCAISGRPGTSSRQRTPLTPLFPLHPRKLPVSPLFPLLTQKQGGVPPSSGMTNRSILESLLARSSPCGPFSAAPLFSVLSVYSVVSLLSAAFPCSPLATRRSPLSLTIPVHTRGAPVSPIIPVHPQKHGGGGFQSNVSSYNSFVFFDNVNYTVKSNCRRADIPILARGTNAARATGTRHQNRGDWEKGAEL